VVALGATAALALAGKPLSVSGNRGPFIFKGGSRDRPGYITIHPSFLLRMPDKDKAKGWKDFVADMKRIHKLEREKLAA